MHYFISTISFIFLFYVPTATASVDKNDDTFLAFVKGDPNQNNEVLIQMYEARLGLMYLMRENWKCDKIRKEIKKEEKEYEECEKLRKYLDILYEYLFQVYTGPETAADQIVKPMFKHNDKVGTIIEVLEKLSNLSRFFFVRNIQQLYNAPVLSNEGKLTFALNNANSITLREQFDKKLKEMLDKTKKNEAKKKPN